MTETPTIGNDRVALAAERGQAGLPLGVDQARAEPEPGRPREDDRGQLERPVRGDEREEVGRLGSRRHVAEDRPQAGSRWRPASRGSPARRSGPRRSNSGRSRRCGRCRTRPSSSRSAPVAPCRRSRRAAGRTSAPSSRSGSRRTTLAAKPGRAAASERRQQEQPPERQGRATRSIGSDRSRRGTSSKITPAQSFRWNPLARYTALWARPTRAWR